MGEPAGIGPDITIAAWLRRRELSLQPFVCIADPAVLIARASMLGVDVEIAEVGKPADAIGAFATALPVMAIDCPAIEAGTPVEASANAVIGAIERAVALTLAGEAGAVVTNPIAKSVLARAGFAYPGHTEFLAALSARGGPEPRPVMMLAAPPLKVVPVTTHIAVKDVPGALTRDLIVDIARITADGLKRYFATPRPRLVVAGLNPHAGEDGLMGDEDARIIRPAVAALVAAGVDASGPVSADTLFHAEARAGYDAAICMYHDQALIPVKTLAFDQAVNVTLGLPFLRTSPDHGTAFSLAGSGRAREASLVAALRLASAHPATSAAPAPALG